MIHIKLQVTFGQKDYKRLVVSIGRCDNGSLVQ